MDNFKKLIFMELCSVQIVYTSFVSIITLIAYFIMKAIGYDSTIYNMVFVMTWAVLVLFFYRFSYPMRDYFGSLVEINYRYKFFINIWRGKFPEYFNNVIEMDMSEKDLSYFFANKNDSGFSDIGRTLLDDSYELYKLRKKGSQFRKKYNLAKEDFFRKFEELDENQADEAFEFVKKIQTLQSMIQKVLISPYTKLEAVDIDKYQQEV